VHKHKKRVLSTPQQNSQQMVMMTYWLVVTGNMGSIQKYLMNFKPIQRANQKVTTGEQ
jgi:hypothetical protein